ncbi:hypothetical protein [Streptomyces thermolilacinus]|uniref:hypothetical protein n=1 Tax=Streptomyces thermolilacinus TaxID=285540 RepID=UPI0034046038
MTALTALTALATRPLFFSFSAAISSSTDVSASVYFVASVSTSWVPLSSTARVSSSNLSVNPAAARCPMARRSAGSFRTASRICARPWAIRSLARFSSAPIVSATSETTCRIRRTYVSRASSKILAASAGSPANRSRTQRSLPVAPEYRRSLYSSVFRRCSAVNASRAAFSPPPELVVDQLVEPLEDALDVLLHRVEDTLENRRDLGPLLLVPPFRAPLARVHLLSGTHPQGTHRSHGRGAEPVARAVEARSSAASCLRNRPGAVEECRSAAFFSPSALVNAGSLDFLSCASVTRASAIRRSTPAGPADMSVADAGSRSGTACAGFGVAGARGGRSPAIGTPFLGTAAEVSGGAAVVVAICSAESALPSPTLPCTSARTSSALPEAANLSASSRFFGALSARPSRPPG